MRNVEGVMWLLRTVRIKAYKENKFTLRKKKIRRAPRAKKCYIMQRVKWSILGNLVLFRDKFTISKIILLKRNNLDKRGCIEVNQTKSILLEGSVKLTT